MDNNAVIKTLTLYGNSLKKLYKFLPESCIKAVPNKTSDSKYDLEVNLGGVIFTGKDENSYLVINNYNRNYTKEELMAFQKIATDCYTYPFGWLGFSIVLNILGNDKTEKTMNDLINKHEIKHLTKGLDSEGHIKLDISDVKDYSTPSFINFILELQTLTNLLN